MGQPPEIYHEPSICQGGVVSQRIGMIAGIGPIGRIDPEQRTNHAIVIASIEQIVCFARRDGVHGRCVPEQSLAAERIGETLFEFRFLLRVVGQGSVW